MSITAGRRPPAPSDTRDSSPATDTASSSTTHAAAAKRGERVGLGRRAKDVAGALAFLGGRPDVDANRIGGLGLSTGADVLLEVAAERRELKAVVADGATAASFADYRSLVGLDEAAPFFATMYTAARVLSGSGPGEPLEQLVASAPTPLLLIAAGKGVAQEQDFNRLYAAAAREPVELWDARGPPHGGDPGAGREYEERVVGLAGRALAPSRCGRVGGRAAAASDRGSSASTSSRA